MDERAIKRLLVILAVSIIAIFLFKAMMTRSIVNLNKVVAEKKQAVASSPAAQQEAVPVSDAAIVVETPAALSASAAIPEQPASGAGGAQ